MASGLRRPAFKLVSVVVVLGILFNFSPALVAVRAQRRIIVVRAEQPNVWTLEQAHYLLAQMHRRNLDLRAKSLDDLDANEIAGLRFDIVRTLIEFGATFNQADLASNRLLSNNQAFNTERRQSLIARRDKLNEESLELTRQISALQTEKARSSTDAEKARIDAEITAKTTLRDSVDKQAGQANAELGTIAAPSGTPTATEGEAEFDPDRLPKSAFDEAFEDAARKQIERFNDAPRINASLQLENFLQLQYEIISKQLTLLRDEVGPGERLVFLELPQTVNAAHHESKRKWAQSWWKIAGYTVRCPDAEAARHVAVPERCKGQLPRASGYHVTEALSQAKKDARRETQDKNAKEETQDAEPQGGETQVPTGEEVLQSMRPITMAQDVASLLKDRTVSVEGRRDNRSGREVQVNYVSKFINLDDPAFQDVEDGLKNYLDKTGLSLSNQMVRTVELIPRQSSLNVNDMNLRVKSGAFNFVLSTLFGFGSRLNVQRQREQFSQFVQQELYSAAFGKGSREFGWTFTPMPGTDRLHSGVRTTYAAVVVPEEATSVVLESNGCYFPRSFYPPNDYYHTTTPEWDVPGRTSRNCGARKVFVVRIPSAGFDGSNDFWVEKVSYQPVNKNERIVVTISGKNFSSQIGVLVNGVPLAHALGLAQPLIRDDSRAFRDAMTDLKGEKVRGRVERVDANQIVFSFEAADFEGTPVITLVAPGKAIDINWLETLSINGTNPATMLDSHSRPCDKIPQPPNCVTRAAWMFGERPRTENFRIDRIEVFRGASRTVSILLHGAGFQPLPPATSLFVNGMRRPFNAVSPTLIEVTGVPIPSDDTVQATLVYNEDTIKSQPVPNPARIRVTGVQVVSYEEPKDDRPGVLVVRLEGVNFPDWLNSNDPNRIRVVVTSSTEAFLTITNPRAAEVITLTDPVTSLSVNAVVTRKKPSR